MIIPGLSEDKILDELLFDREVVANKAKKIATKIIACLKKQGRDGINQDLSYTYNITTNKNNNKWLTVIAINMAHTPKWFHRTACVVESEKGTKDYYFVRGFSNKKHYFIKISSHVAKRFVERGFEQRLNKNIQFDEDFIPFMFRPGEVVTWMKIAEPKLWQLALDSLDSHVIQNLFYTSYGCFIGFETKQGNYEFKTCLRNDKKLKKIGETKALDMCHYAHVAFNPSFYEKNYVEKLYNEELQTVKDMYEDKNLILMP